MSNKPYIFPSIDNMSLLPWDIYAVYNKPTFFIPTLAIGSKSHFDNLLWDTSFSNLQKKVYTTVYVSVNKKEVSPQIRKKLSFCFSV